MNRRFVFVLAALAFAGGCSDPTPGQEDTGLDLLVIGAVNPAIIVPNSPIVVSGTSFVDDSLGASQLHLVGMLDGRSFDAAVPAVYKSATELDLSADSTLASALGGSISGHFAGQATIEVMSTVDHHSHASPAIMIELDFEASLTPSVTTIGDGVAFVNSPIEVNGSGFLLGGPEGKTVAHLEGCFTKANGTSCDPIAPIDVTAVPKVAYNRSQVIFPYATGISGIEPGEFDGMVTISNQPAMGSATSTDPQTVTFQIQPPQISGASTTGASLGQYVFIEGGGFVGAATDADPSTVDPSESTTLELTGTFTSADGATTKQLDVQLVPQFVTGLEVRYVIDETDALGLAVPPRTSPGTISGMVSPIVRKGDDMVTGSAVAVSLQILPVKQVVYVNFLDGYVSSLRKFGMRALDSALRARIFQVAKRDYQGVNIEFRDTIPTDFALFSTVDISGPDPNGLGQLGYDNSPGRDVNNLRLYDHVGGVNATTLANGDAGYGGVFVEDMFEFSKHPGHLATSQASVASTAFDQTFDPFRPDLSGNEVTATELAANPPAMLTDGTSCPARVTDRAGQIACATWVLANMIGSTMTHEVGHSLGLANPNGGDLHDVGNLPNRLMEQGGNRPFLERAELQGQGPGVFCADAYIYLRKILPSTEPATTFDRPMCTP